MSSSLAPEQREWVDVLQRRALVVGAAALVVCVVGAFFSPTQFFRAYLAAYVFCLGIGLGSLVILMIYHLTGGAWGFLVRRILEATTRTIPLLAVLFIPVACGVRYLYLWTDPDIVKADLSLQYKQIYLNLPFFYGRAVLYFVLWSLMAYLFSRWSRLQDESGDPALAARMRRLSGPGLVVYGLSLTFAAVDWIMSLQPAFHSTIFGPLVASSELASALAFTLVVLIRLAPRPPLAEFVSPDVFRDLGNLLLTFLILWAYMAFFQFMLIWIANLPYEVIWYLPRARHGWEWVTWALFLFGLVVPFFSLLMREVKERPRSLEKVAWLMLFMHLIFAYYLVVPNFPDTTGQTHLQVLAAQTVTSLATPELASGMTQLLTLKRLHDAFALPDTTIVDHWMDFLTPLAVGGLWLAYFLYELKRRALLPLHDLSRESALDLRAVDEEESHEEEEAARA